MMLRTMAFVAANLPGGPTIHAPPSLDLFGVTDATLERRIRRLLRPDACTLIAQAVAEA